MRGKLIEDLLYTQVVAAGKYSSAPGTQYNGVAQTITGNGIDTRECDEINFIINVGVMHGAGTLDVAIMDSATDDPDDATLITGNASPSDTASTSAAFTQITAANDNGLHTASIKAKEFKRYMWARTRVAGASANFGIIAVKGKCDRDPQTNSPVFDLNY
jgi:hypothetical protein